MKRIEITVQSVQRGLRAGRLLLDDSVRLTFGWLVRGGSRPSICLFLRKKGPRKAKNNLVNLVNFLTQYFWVLIGGVPLPTRWPPNPPDPRMKTVD